MEPWNSIVQRLINDSICMVSSLIALVSKQLILSGFWDQGIHPQPHMLLGERLRF